MTHVLLRLRLQLAACAAALLVAALPQQVLAGEDPKGAAGQPPPGRSPVVIEEVHNGPVFGVEFKFTEIDHQDAYLLGGYVGALFDDKLLVGGAGYWQVDDYWNHYGGDYYYGDYYYGDCYHGCGGYDGGYHGTGYGGLIVEAYPLRSSVVSLSIRGLVGGGVTTVGWNGYYYGDTPGYPQPHDAYYDYGYYGYDQTYFIFEPQVNVSVRLARGVAMVGGVGYRVIGWANGWEDQIGGLTGSFAVRFGGR